MSQILLFDLDGTITDSAPGIHAGFTHALAAVGRTPTPELLDSVIGPPMVDTFHRMGMSADEVARALDAYFEYYGNCGWAENSVYDGMAELLEQAQQPGRRLAVATSKTERFAVRILDHFGLAGHFDFIGGASDDGRRRAKADVIAHSLDALGTTVAPASEGGTSGVVMIGDRNHDVHGAAHWGIPTLFVEWGYGTAGEDDGAHRTVSTVDQLGRILRNAA